MLITVEAPKEGRCFDCGRKFDPGEMVLIIPRHRAHACEDREACGRRSAEAAERTLDEKADRP